MRETRHEAKEQILGVEGKYNMILNPDFIKDKYKCGESIKNYLVFQCGIPILSHDGVGKYYFSKSEKLEKCVKKIPLGIKIKALFEKI